MNELILIVTSFLASTLAGITAMGGGVLLISVMAAFLPPLAIVPVHGVVMFASNATRALFGFRHIEWPIFRLYFCGGIIGAAIGSRFIKSIPAEIIPLLLGSFILIVTWIPTFKIEKRIPAKFFWMGGIQTFLSLFVGATGPLLSSVLVREGMERDRLVVTHAFLMTSAHLLKVTTFGLVGFVFTPYIPLLVGMIAGVTLGSYFGTYLRGKVPEKPFRQVLKTLLTILALRMILKVMLT
jgi:uncharacterized membrane protein YfcA